MKHPGFRLLPPLFLGACLAFNATAQKLEVTPAEALADTPVDLRVTGLQPHQAVQLHANLLDGAGQSWASEADFVASDHGDIDTATQAPLRGAYRQVSGSGLIWSMRPTSRDAHIYVPPPQLAAQTVTFQLFVAGKVTAEQTIRQLAIMPGVQQIHVKGVLHGTLLLPTTPGQHPGVLVVGGSEGGLPLRKAAWLASHGYVALALAYFRFDSLPRTLSEIPVEYFGEALQWLGKQPQVVPSELAVMGTSRGGELALQLGSLYPEVHAVIAYVPANVRFPACCGARLPGAAWTLQGRPLAYEIPWARDPASALAAAIPVERIHGPILLISGGEDGVWPSQEMSEEVMDRLRHEHFVYPFQNLNYPHAGHRAGLPEIEPAWMSDVRQPISGQSMHLGGTPEGNADSSLEAPAKVLSFLQQSLHAPAATSSGSP